VGKTPRNPVEFEVPDLLENCNSTASPSTFAPTLSTWTGSDNLRTYQLLTTSEFEHELEILVDEGRLSDFQELEPERSWNRWQGERWQRKYLAHVPDLHGYLIIKSGVDPYTDTSNGRGLHSIRLFFRRQRATVAKRQTNRLPRWRENLRRALDEIREEAGQ